jgi:hypothetical protein
VCEPVGWSVPDGESRGRNDHDLTALPVSQGRGKLFLRTCDPAPNSHPYSLGLTPLAQTMNRRSKPDPVRGPIPTYARMRPRHCGETPVGAHLGVLAVGLLPVHEALPGARAVQGAVPAATTPQTVHSFISKKGGRCGSRRPFACGPTPPGPRRDCPSRSRDGDRQTRVGAHESSSATIQRHRTRRRIPGNANSAAGAWLGVVQGRGSRRNTGRSTTGDGCSCLMPGYQPTRREFQADGGEGGSA